MQLYYSDNIENKKIILDEVESGHCIKVLRKKVGDYVFVTNGKGQLFEARISEIQKRNVTSVIEKTTFTPENPHKYCHIAIAPTKNTDRFEWFLEKATEIGIGRITPIICDNSERKSIRVDRLEKILISAMKQSLKTYKPTLEDYIRFEQFIVNQKNSKQKFIAHCQGKNPKHLFTTYQEKNDVVVLIGPEGDFSEIEINQAMDMEFEEVSLGNSRLRTETAGVVACGMIVTKNTLAGLLPG